LYKSKKLYRKISFDIKDLGLENTNDDANMKANKIFALRDSAIARNEMSTKKIRYPFTETLNTFNMGIPKVLLRNPVVHNSVK
jgi:hypothetical protein